jgi:hypothetical protein
MMYGSLHTQAASRMATIRRGSAAETRRYRRSFMFGFAERIRQLLQETVDRAERDADRSAPGGSVGLALRHRSDVVSAFLRDELGPVRRARPVANVAPQGYAAGAQAAGSADIGRRRVAGQLALDAGGRTVA